MVCQQSRSAASILQHHTRINRKKPSGSDPYPVPVEDSNANYSGKGEKKEDLFWSL
jgi:hypothetical protein